MTTLNTEGQAAGPHSPKKPRAPKNVKPLTDLGIKHLNAGKHLDKVNADRAKRGLKPATQDLIWDSAQKGLALLIGQRTKTFRCQFRLADQYVMGTIGRFGELVAKTKENGQISKARKIAQEWRAIAKEGIDPRGQQHGQHGGKLTFGTVVDEFIELHARPKQRTWDQTEGFSRAAASLNRPIAAITEAMVHNLLDGFVAAGHGHKARVTQRG